MSERGPQGSETGNTWPVARIAERMEQTPVPVHPGDGIDGHGFKVVDPAHPEDARTIGLFPDQHVVTIATPDVSIRIKNATATAARDGMSIESGDGSLRALFLRDGHIAVEVFPAPSLALSESPLSGGKTPVEDLPESSSQMVSGASDDAETASREAVETPQSAEQRERQPRVKITGRLGADPHYEQSGKSGLIARFPLAEQTTEEQASWHRVYSTGTRAERVQALGLGKGDKVKVDGYRQEREYRKKDGSTVKQEVVFAVHVKKLGAQPPNE